MQDKKMFYSDPTRHKPKKSKYFLLTVPTPLTTLIKIPQDGQLRYSFTTDYSTDYSTLVRTYLVAAADDSLLVAVLVPGVSDASVLVQDGVVEGVGLALEKHCHHCDLGLETSIFIFLSQEMVIGLLREIVQRGCFYQEFHTQSDIQFDVKSYNQRETFSGDLYSQTSQ